ncbi:DNRLRE domain-containing protein, partial [Clostridia bacterium OttesenSCG-928-F22]|nr:DNRLRE domain-containing protein [Clostridia bacterium OttesenSCG-928-F22]
MIHFFVLAGKNPANPVLPLSNERCIPAYNTLVEDYSTVNTTGKWYTWDVTNIVQGWYENAANTGMMFKAADAQENNRSYYKGFYSSDYSASTRPALYIYYQNTSGLENYWDYQAQSAGRAGTGYVNLFSGNLVWVQPLLGVDGNRMPVSIKQIYNANDKLENNFGMAMGWRTNYHQRILPEIIKGVQYYVWEDEDGTKHYFKLDSGSTYKDESGAELTLTTNGSGAQKYCLTDKNGNKSYFDTVGRLTKIQNNQQTPSSNEITYIDASSWRIAQITDGVGRVYAFSYDANNALSSIEYMGTGNTALQWVNYGHVNTNLVGVSFTDGRSVSFGYTANNLLYRATDIDGYFLQYNYNTTDLNKPNRITRVQEYQNTSGQFNTFAYGHRQTTITDHLNNKMVCQFNQWGNTISVQDKYGKATYARYAQEENTNSKANQMVLSSKLQGTMGRNHLNNSSFEGSGGWSAVQYNGASGCSSPFTTSQKYFGSKSMQLTKPSYTGLYRAEQTVGLVVGKTYTLSGYIKTDVSYKGSGVGVCIGFEMLSSPYPGVFTEQITANNVEWTRFEATFTATYHTAMVQCLMGDGVSGTAYFDCLQLEEAETASRYNLLQNGDFSAGTASWSGSGVTWSSSVDTVTAGNPTAAPQLDANMLRFMGSIVDYKQVCQHTYLSGAAGDVYTASAWSKGKSAPNTDGTRRYGIVIYFRHTDGTNSQTYIPFNENAYVGDEWFYAAGRAVAEKAYSDVRFYMLFEINPNTVYFDGAQLFKEEFGQSYAYDSQGNVTSVQDIRQKQTEYEYTSNDLTKSILPNGGELTYSYDGHHNVTAAENAMGYQSSFEYDAYGNMVSAKTQDKDNAWWNIQSDATYTSDGNYVSTITDAARNTSTYSTDGESGLLGWTQAPLDDTDHRVWYLYDDMGRVTDVLKNVTGAPAVVSNKYTYENDRIKRIEHSNTASTSTTYTFSYGNMGVPTTTQVGNRTLVSNIYDSYHRLSQINYGNGGKVQYGYDSQGRVSVISYDNYPVLFAYDNEGRLAKVTDRVTWETINYRYDFAGRLVSTKKGQYTQQLGYDLSNNVNSISEQLGSTRYATQYVYDKDNKLIEMNAGGGTTGYYAYDSYSR